MLVPFLRFLTLATLLSQALAAEICLGVERDTVNNKGGTIGKNNLVSYGSVLTLSNPSVQAVTDENLAWLSMKGHAEMVAAWTTQYEGRDPKGAPTAMIVFAPGTGNKIFLGSSIKNLKNPKQFYTREVLIQFLEDCEHRTGGRCGEFNTVQAFLDEGGSDCEIPANSRMVAWVAGKVAPACVADKEGQVGCKEFLAKLGIRDIQPGVQLSEPSDWTFVSSNQRNNKGNGEGPSS